MVLYVPLQKGGLPPGTTRDWGGRKYRKMGDGTWKPVPKLQLQRPKLEAMVKRLTSEKDIAHSLEMIKLIYKRRPKGMGEVIPIVSRADLGKILDKTKIGIISAGKNPKLESDMSKEEQLKRHEALKAELIDLGYVITEVEGMYDGEEPSIMFIGHDATRNEIKALGKKYNQDSVIFVDEGNNEMIYTTGENAGKRHVGKGFEWKPDADNYYSKVTTGSETSKFALNFDFDALIKSLMLVLKGRGLPEGTVRVHGGIKKKKIGGEWTPVGGSKPIDEREKSGWQKFSNVEAAKSAAMDLSKKNPGKYVTMSVVFDEVKFNLHSALPKGVYAPGDWKHGYALDGKWKNWSAARKERYKHAMIESSEGSDK